MRISDWSSDVCSSDLPAQIGHRLDAQLCRRARAQFRQRVAEAFDVVVTEKSAMDDDAGDVALAQYAHQFVGARSEEHTSELQSLMRISYAVFCLKKKKQTTHSYCYNIRRMIDNDSARRIR